MSFRDLVARHAKTIFLTTDMPDVEEVRYCPKGTDEADAITLNALVERAPADKARADRGRTVESPLVIEIAVADVASPAVGDQVHLSPRLGQPARWVEITQLLRADDGIHRMELGR